MRLRSMTIFFLVVFASFSSLAQGVKVVKFDSIKEILKNHSNQVKVVNFWATWCGPCIKELPNFEAINVSYDNVEVILVNLDFVEGIDKVNRFVEKKALKSKVILLDEIDYNTWINQVSPDWSGAIPATIIIGPHAVDKKFLEGELTASELENALKRFL